MDRVVPHFQVLLVSNFVRRLIEAEHSRPHLELMTKSTIQETLHQVGARFRENFPDDSNQSLSGKAHPIIKLQLNRNKYLEPRTKQQRCLNPSFIHHCHNRSTTLLEMTMSELVALGFFFSIITCEFTVTTGFRKL